MILEPKAQHKTRALVIANTKITELVEEIYTSERG
jgi:hypothetical protein